jgi:hypothetical protein
MENYVEILKEAHTQLTTGDEKTISIKDLTMCHRKKVFSVIDPVPMTDEQLYDYVSGQAAHDVIERLFMVFPNRFRSEKELQYKNIKGKIDIHDKLLNSVIEIKTNKSKILLKPQKFHEEQVKYYMSMIDSDEGQILYHLNNFRNYRSFEIYMNAEQRRDQLQKLEIEAKALRRAIEAKDPSLVRGVYDDNEMYWMCNRCPYLEKCKQMRQSSEQEKVRLEVVTSNILPINEAIKEKKEKTNEKEDESYISPNIVRSGRIYDDD